MLRRILLVLSFFAAASAAHAGPGQAKRDEIRERIRAMRIARLIQILDLDEKGASRLTPIIDRAYDQIAVVTKDSGEARRELRTLIAVQPPTANDDARMNRLIDRLLANKTKVEQIESSMTAEVRRVLAPSQVARLVVVLPEINHQIQQQIRKAAAGQDKLRPNQAGKDVGDDDGF